MKTPVKNGEFILRRQVQKRRLHRVILTTSSRMKLSTGGDLVEQIVGSVNVVFETKDMILTLSGMLSGML